MNAYTMKVTYSLIGSMSAFLKENNDRIKNLMADYALQSKEDKLEDGTAVESLMFTKENVNVRFLPARIDYTYNFGHNPDGNMMREAKDAACAFFHLLGTWFSAIRAKRIACVSASFINNENDAAIKYMTEHMGILARFGTSNELHFKINTPVNAFEPLNSVVNVDMGTVKNNSTGVESPCLLLSLDVNTLAKNTEERFSPFNVSDKFSLFCDLVVERLELIGTM